LIGSIERVIRAHTTGDDASEGSVLVISVCESFGLTMLDAIADRVALLTPARKQIASWQCSGDLHIRVSNSHGTATGSTIKSFREREENKLFNSAEKVKSSDGDKCIGPKSDASFQFLTHSQSSHELVADYGARSGSGRATP
jgi:hypothetical protein